MIAKVSYYSTDVPAKKSVSEIQELLGEHGAEQIVIEYATIKFFGHQPVSLFFSITCKNQKFLYRIPCKWETTLTRLRDDVQTTPAQRSARYALNVAWRTVRIWIQSQLAFIASGQVEMREVFLPYMLVPGDGGEQITVYQQFGQHIALPRT